MYRDTRKKKKKEHLQKKKKETKKETKLMGLPVKENHAWVSKSFCTRRNFTLQFHLPLVGGQKVSEGSGAKDSLSCMCHPGPWAHPRNIFSLFLFICFASGPLHLHTLRATAPPQTLPPLMPGASPPMLSKGCPRATWEGCPHSCLGVYYPFDL